MVESPPSADDSGDPTEPSVLVIADFSPNLEKVDRHIQPLAATTSTTMVCISPTASDDIDFLTVPSFGWRPLGLCLMFWHGLLEAWRGNYDAIVSFSLIPHGTFALIVARLTGTPVHVATIGADIDVHARSRYRAAVRFLLRQFDLVTVPGATHRQELEEFGLESDRIAILTNPIDADEFVPKETETHVDLLWVGRLSPEKDPLVFVEACRQLRNRNVSFSAVIVGDGPLAESIRDRLAELDLEEHVSLVGWIDDPTRYYQRAEIFALTSERDALPLTLLEAMASGCAPVVPAVGNVTDVANDGETALVVDDRAPSRFADAFEHLLTTDDVRRRLQRNATVVRYTHSLDRTAMDWKLILQKLLAHDSSAPEDRNSRARSERESTNV